MWRNCHSAPSTLITCSKSIGRSTMGGESRESTHFRISPSLRVRRVCNMRFNCLKGSRHTEGPTEKCRCFGRTRTWTECKTRRTRSPFHTLTRFDSDFLHSLKNWGFQDEMLECISALVDLDRDWIPDSPTASLYIRPTMIGTNPHLGLNVRFYLASLIHNLYNFPS